MITTQFAIFKASKLLCTVFRPLPAIASISFFFFFCYLCYSSFSVDLDQCLHSPCASLTLSLFHQSSFLGPLSIGTDHCRPETPTRSAVLEMLSPNCPAIITWPLSTSVRSLFVFLLPAHQLQDLTLHWLSNLFHSLT